jgi:pyruvate dehydrogenase E1 component
MSYQSDPDPQETREWVASLQSLIAVEGEARAEFLLQQLFDTARRSCRGLKFNATTAYCNTIPYSEQPPYPGDLALEDRITSLVRWNALAMVVRANREHPELGGHIATYASAADLFEVGLNHFFRAGQDGDLIYFQPHCSTGIYARAYLEGRLSETQLLKYRQETRGGGLSSYPHPWLMPDFWQFPNASMGLGPINAIYQARFMRYLEDRAMIKSARPPSDRKVWAFVGDGEMDEPESLAGLSLAAREKLDNLIFVVNCNLQRLDGPVRGNGSIIQELEGLFTGAGWNVIKLLWGSDWDALFARDREGVLLQRLHETVDGELQKYAATDGRFNREHFFNKYPELQALVADLSDADIDRLRRGGHDPVKIYSAYYAATRSRGRPTVILAQTKKGYGMGQWGEGKMTAHQAKKLETDALLAFRDRFSLPLSDADVAALRFYRPAEDSHEIKYLRARRKILGGAMPSRARNAPALPAPPLSTFARVIEGSPNHDGREESTTMSFVALLSQLLKSAEIGKHVVPIVADEARTFGMQTLFRQFAIYSSTGQMYEPEDRDELLYYKEARNGQIIEEGITEAGAMSSWIAAATAYSTHGVTMLPFYIFYSIFGFQRVADLIWGAGDSRARGFLIGATSGRTTLSGEGLQHQDGSSHVTAATFPNCVSYDPTYGYELAVIVQDGLRRMLDEQEDVFYYLTVTNENYRMPAMPGSNVPSPALGRERARVRVGEAPETPPPRKWGEGVTEGILRGMYLLREGNKHKNRVQLMGSGTILREVLAAAEILENDYHIAADVWSVTSFTELARDGMAAERWNRLHPEAAPRASWVEQCLRDRAGPVIAATDYVRNFAEPIRAWVDRPYTVLGTDGFGRSDTRELLRRFFEVDRAHIAVAALKALADQEVLPAATVSSAIRKFGINAENIEPWRA